MVLSNPQTYKPERRAIASYDAQWHQAGRPRTIRIAYQHGYAIVVQKPSPAAFWRNQQEEKDDIKVGSRADKEMSRNHQQHFFYFTQPGLGTPYFLSSEKSAQSIKHSSELIKLNNRHDCNSRSTKGHGVWRTLQPPTAWSTITNW